MIYKSPVCDVVQQRALPGARVATACTSVGDDKRTI